MPNVILQAPVGSGKENLQAILLGHARWGNNGTAWGQPTQVDAGSPTIISIYAGQSETAEGTVAIGNHAVTFTVTANGSGHTVLTRT